MKIPKCVTLAIIVLFGLSLTPATSLGLKVGHKAPTFIGESTHGTIRLADLAGKQHVILALYFAIFTPVWADEVKAFQRDLEKFKQLDAEVIGVSADNLEANVKFAAENDIDFPLVSDTRKSIRKSYGRGRVTYLIDKNGIIRDVQKGVPDNQALLEKLEQIM